MTYYRQCKLVSGPTTTVAWLNDEGKLKVGNRVTLKDSDEPQRWWTVELVGDERMEERMVRTMERAYLRQRAVSDI